MADPGTGTEPITPGSTRAQELKLDYAWKWFNFHAEQRTKMFNYMLVGLGFLATAAVTTLQKRLILETEVLSAIAILICVAFGLMDYRNRKLYHIAEQVLADLEPMLFREDEPGIARAVLKEPQTRAFDVRTGRHRFWMPFVIGMFAIGFLAAGVRAHLLSGEPSRTDQGGGEACLRCCCTPDLSNAQPSGSTPRERAFPPGGHDSATPVTLEGTGRTSGWHWIYFGCCMLVIAIGVVLFARKHRAWGSAVAAAGLAAASVPNVSIPITGHFHLDPSFEGKIEGDLEVKMDHLLDLFNKHQPALLASGKFGGFGEGLESFDCAAASNLDVIHRINASLAQARESHLKPMVLLVGGTDRKGLSPALRKRFETNTGLARARVQTVEGCLALPTKANPLSPETPPEVIRLITGPSYTPANPDSDAVASEKLAEDREVRVFVIALKTQEPPH